MSLVLGIDIGGTNTKVGVVTRDGEVLVNTSIATRYDEGPGPLAGRVDDWARGAVPAGERIVVAGIGCAGLVDSDRGLLHYSPNMPGWEKAPLGRIFSESLGVDVRVENDVNAFVWGEYVMGAGRGTRHFVGVTVGTGIGGGIIADGRLLRGAAGFAGEIGHTVIQIDGPPCGCGRRGCLESFAGAAAIVERARSKLGGGASSVLTETDAFTVEDISRAAAGGDVLALEVFEETGRYLGIGLSNIVHLVNPETIAIGGGIAAAGELLLRPARRELERSLVSDVLAGVRLVRAELGSEASFLGAALLALSRRD